MGGPKIVFYHGESRIANSLWQMVKQQAILRFKTYSMGKYTNVTWGENWDVEYLMDNLIKMSFGKVIHDMYELNPKASRNIQHVEACSWGSLKLDST